jgi:hypothetical protein
MGLHEQEIGYMVLWVVGWIRMMVSATIPVGLVQVTAFQKPTSSKLGFLVLKQRSRTLISQVADGFLKLNLCPMTVVVLL